MMDPIFDPTTVPRNILQWQLRMTDPLSSQDGASTSSLTPPPLASCKVSAVVIPPECVYGSRRKKDRRFGSLERGGGHGRCLAASLTTHPHIKMPDYLHLCLTRTCLCH